MTRDDRASPHERFAEWLKHDQSDQYPEFAQSLGYHVSLGNCRDRSGKE